MSQVRLGHVSDNCQVPFPAVPLPVSFAIGIPVALGLFVAQEVVLQRRAAHRADSPAPGAPVNAPVRATPPAGVTVAAPALPTAPVRGARTRAAAPAKPVAATPAVPAPKRAPSNPAGALRRRLAALNQGLEAIIEFVDGPVRRKPAASCAEALKGAVPKARRGPALNAFLVAVEAGVAPSRLQEMAEDAGVEVAIAIRQVTAEIRALAA